MSSTTGGFVPDAHDCQPHEPVKQDQTNATLPMGDIEVSQMFINPGQTLTVWLSSATEDGFPRAQVELRVTPGGKHQIFTSGDIELRGFSTWKSHE